MKTTFITGQDATREQSERYCTYMGHITPQMVAGSYKRYSEKSFGDKALLTYGYGDGGVLRLYECQNRRTNATLTFGIPVTRVLLCDMLERALEELPVEDGKVTVPFKGFEIITLKILS
ncbi:MAG: hypothetical protein IJC99_03220 [Clostridia bacterium]|nr:hypothetical protein [Clostridia bacterium]